MMGGPHDVTTKRSVADYTRIRPAAIACLVVVISFSTTPFASAAEFCVKGTEAEPFQLSKSIPDSFRADLYMVDITQNKGYRVKEHYSKAAKVASIRLRSTWSNKWDKFFVRDLSTGVALTNWNDGTCQKETGDEPRFGFMSFRDSKDVSITYVGKDKLNGQTVYLWRGCHGTASGDQIKEDIYISGKNSDWSTPSGKDYTPLKMIRQVKKSGQTDVIQTNYYVLKFEAADIDDNSFQADLSPPIGTVCPSSSPVKIPDLPDSIYYSQEVDADTVKTYIVDPKKKLIFEEDRHNYYSGKPEIVIDNYNMGVTVTLEDNSCSFSSYAVLENDELNRTLGYLDSQDDEEFTTVDSFIGAEDKIGFTYNGQHKVRGIPCDVYTKVYDDYKGSGKTVVILYFTAKTVKVNGNSLSQTLVKKFVSKPGSYYGNERSNSIFGLKSLDYSSLPFDPQDITQCESRIGAYTFGMIFKGDGKTKLSLLETRNLKHSMRSTLAKAAGVEEMRMHVSAVAVSSGATTVEGKLLGPPPHDNVHEVYGEPVDVPQENVIDTRWSYSSDACKERLDEDGVEMVSYCSKSCTTYNKKTDKENVKRTYSCRIFYKGKNSKKPLALDAAWNSLAMAVDNGEVKVQGYTASDVVKQESLKTDETEYSIYQRYDNVRISKPMSKMQFGKFSDCATRCTHSLTYECEAFTFCEKTKLCLLNSVDNDHDYKDRMETDEQCNAYVRKYTSEFSQIPGTSALAGTDMLFEKVEDPNACAHLCLNNNMFRCESFDFCTLDGEADGGSGTCSLGREHVFSIAKNSHNAVLPNTKCSHYSRKYLGDYEQKAGVTSLPAISTLQISDPEACAHACSEYDSSGEAECTLFQMCDGVCELLDESSITSARGRKAAPIKEKKGCQTYTLKDETYQTHGRAAARRRAQTAALASDKKSSSGGQYGPGSMAVLALVMLPVAFGAVFLALFAWSRFQTAGGMAALRRKVQGPSSFDNPSMKFSKDNLDSDI